MVRKKVDHFCYDWVDDKPETGRDFEYSKENMMQKIHYHIFAILTEELSFHYLTFLFTFFEMEFNPRMIRQAIVTTQLSTLNNIFKATAEHYFDFSVTFLILLNSSCFLFCIQKKPPTPVLESN